MTAEEYVVNRVHNLEDLLDERDVLISDMVKTIEKYESFMKFLKSKTEVRPAGEKNPPYVVINCFGVDFEKGEYAWNFLEIGDKF